MNFIHLYQLYLSQMDPSYLPGQETSDQGLSYTHHSPEKDYSLDKGLEDSCPGHHFNHLWPSQLISPYKSSSNIQCQEIEDFLEADTRVGRSQNL